MMRALLLSFALLVPSPLVAADVGPIPYTSLGQPNGPAKLDATGRANLLSVVPSGATTPRALADWVGDTVNVLSFGADKTGVANASPAINAAIARAATSGVGAVFLPAGTYRIDLSATGVLLQSGVTLQGAGRGRTTLVVDDSAGATSPGISIATPTAINIHLRDMTVRGRADIDHTPGPRHHVILQNCSNCSITDVESMYSRIFGLLVIDSDGVVLRGNRIFRSVADGIAVWGTSNAIIAENEIVGANDDAISAHSTDTDPAPVRSGLVITGNTITECQGIDVLGAKMVSITGNTLRRVMTYGIRVESDGGFGQGNTPLFGVTISGNLIADVFQRSEPNPRNGAFGYLVLSGGPRHGAGSGPVPGWPAPSTAALAPPLGAAGTSGLLYANGTSAPAAATPGGGWFQVTGNTLIRTLPASTAWSQWGYGTVLWIGDGGDGSGFYAGGIPETALNYDGIRITGPLQHSRVAGNIIQTSGTNAINFTGYVAGGTILDHDYDGLVIEGNQIVDFGTSGISFYTPAISTQQMTIRDNLFDADPRFVHANRHRTSGVLDGGWTADAAPYGVFAYNLRSTGAGYQRNQFRNLVSPVLETGGLSLKMDNIVSATGTNGFASGPNKGVGHIPAPGSSFVMLSEDSDPRSATFGNLLNAPAPSH